MVRNLRLSDELNVMSDNQADKVIEVSMIETDFDGPLNDGFYLDESDPEDKKMLDYLEIIFKKRTKLDELNSRSPRYFQIQYVKDILKNIEHKLIEL